MHYDCRYLSGKLTRIISHLLACTRAYRISKEVVPLAKKRKYASGNTHIARTRHCIFDSGADAVKVEAAENGVPKTTVRRKERKTETLERHVPQMLLRGEQVAIIIKIN